MSKELAAARLEIERLRAQVEELESRALLDRAKIFNLEDMLERAGATFIRSQRPRPLRRPR